MDELAKQDMFGHDKIKPLEFCEHCVMGKTTRLKFSTNVHFSGGAFGYVHSDLWGPSRIESHSGARYFLSIVDDYCRKVWIYFLKQKNEVFKKFKEWKVLVETQTGNKVKKLTLQEKS